MPSNEEARLAALRRYAILDTEPEKGFQSVVDLAARQFRVPIALVSLIDADRQWFKATCGLDAEGSGRDVAFCAHAILGDGVLCVPDATQDPRFAANPFVTDGIKIRFYAGAPLTTSDGYKLGTLCLIDDQPRHDFSDDDKRLLQDLASIVVDQIQMRDIASDVLTEIEGRLKAEDDLAFAEHQLGLFFEHAPVSVAMLDTELRYMGASRRWRETFDLTDQTLANRKHFDLSSHLPETWQAEFAGCLEGDVLEIDESQMPTADGGMHWVRREVRPWRKRCGAIGGLIAIVEIIDDRKAAADEVERNRTFFEAVLENIQDGIVACDAGGKLSLFNAATRRFHGVDSEPIPPEQWADRYDLFEPDGETPLAMEKIPLFRALNGETVKGQEMVIAAKGNEPRRLVAHAVAMHDGDGNKLGAVASMQDVTNERLAEQKWKDAEERYRAIFNHTFQFCGLVDLDGTVLEVNDTAIDFAGLTRSELVGLPLWDCYWWQVGEATQTQLKDAYKRACNGEFVRYEVEVQGANGTRVPIDFSLKPVADGEGQITKLIAEGRDISDKRKAEEALRMNEERYRILYNKTPVMLHSIDRDGRLLSVSDFWLDKLGYERAEVLGRKSTEFLTPESREMANDILPAFMDTGVCKDIEYQMVSKSGDVIDVLLSAIGERDAGGQIAKSLAVMTDITDRKAVERQFVQAQKMESVGQLTGGLAHDFNNLLGVVLGNLQLIERSVSGDPKATKRVNAALAAVDKGAELTRRLLAFSRRQKLETETVDPNPLIAGMSSLLERTLGESVNLNCHLAEEISRVKTDPTQLESALLNLAVNARDAMPSGGTLTIESENVDLDADYAGWDENIEPGNYVVIAVSDTGTGISKDKIDRVFEPFFTTKEVGKGSGLGLSMVYGFMRQSGGHVRIYSEVGHGTTVRMYLPVDETEIETVGKKTRARLDELTGSETILVVEDQEEVREVAVALLEDLGYTVIEAASGPEGLSALEANPQIDLMFTDIVMSGGMDGTQLAKAAAALRSHLPVVFTTGYAEEAVLQEGEVKAATNLVTKPYNRSELAMKIRAALEASKSRRSDVSSAA